MKNLNSKQEKNDVTTNEDEYGGLSTKKLVIAIAIISIFSLALMIGNPQNSSENIAAAKQEGDYLVIKLTEVTPEVNFYYYESNNVKIRFFAILGTDDQPHIALDACDSCYEAKKGYIYANPYMKCNNCGRTFLVTSIGTENLSGGCWPSHLPISITEGKILIKISDVVLKQWMFD
jgi:uncharacterized membrane protein